MPASVLNNNCFRHVSCSFQLFVKAKAQDVCVKLTEDYESRLQTVSRVYNVPFTDKNSSLVTPN